MAHAAVRCVHDAAPHRTITRPTAPWLISSSNTTESSRPCHVPRSCESLQTAWSPLPRRYVRHTSCCLLAGNQPHSQDTVTSRRRAGDVLRTEEAKFRLFTELRDRCGCGDNDECLHPHTPRNMHLPSTGTRTVKEAIPACLEVISAPVTMRKWPSSSMSFGCVYLPRVQPSGCVALLCCPQCVAHAVLLVCFHRLVFFHRLSQQVY